MLTLSPCAVDSINPSDHHSQPSPRRVPISRRLSQLRKLHLHRLMYLIHPSSSRSSSSPPPLPARQHHLLFQSVRAHHMSKIRHFLSCCSLPQCHSFSQVSYLLQ